MDIIEHQYNGEKENPFYCKGAREATTLIFQVTQWKSNSGKSLLTDFLLTLCGQEERRGVGVRGRDIPHFQKTPSEKHIGHDLWTCLDLSHSHRIVLGKISTSDGPTNAYTFIRGRWVGKLLRCIWKWPPSPLLLCLGHYQLNFRNSLLMN